MRHRACSYRSLAPCQQAGLVKLGHVALDFTKVKANASKHKAMSYQRMKEKAAQLSGGGNGVAVGRAWQPLVRKTGGTARASVEMSCRIDLDFPPGSVGEDTRSHGGAGSRGAGGCRTGRG